MDKNSFALTPPMGWNSYDYYNTTVNEEEIRANAEFMAEHLRRFGYEYIVVDIEWYSYDTGTMPEFQYIPFGRVEMDEYSRLLPCPDKFPSSGGGRGFKPLADYIHSLGLKFGIHIMRGIPREAAHRHCGIKGTAHTADRIADPSNICFWNPDMYGLRPELPESQAYYDSLFELYADWGVDFVKCDDICREDMKSAHDEIRMLHEAIEKCGRPIVLSLSPGPAKPEEAGHYEKYANMWRITDDFWDSWPLLLEMFGRCRLWQGAGKPGCYPDCDMLPVGVIGGRFGEGEERRSNLTIPELRTMMTLWCIMGSPLMMGGELTMMTEEDISLLTNEKLLAMQKCAEDARETRFKESSGEVIWQAKGSADGRVYIALFNISDEETEISMSLSEIRADEACAGGAGRESCGFLLTGIWDEEPVRITDSFSVKVPAHGVRAYAAVPLSSDKE